MTRRAARIDTNHHEIVKALRSVPGVRVESLAAVGDGVPDLLVGFSGNTYLFEVKSRTGNLTPEQRDWHKAWTGHVAIVRTPAEALAALSILGGDNAR